MLICHLYVFFDEVSVKVFDPFFNWIFLLLSFVFRSTLTLNFFSVTIRLNFSR